MSDTAIRAFELPDDFILTPVPLERDDAGEPILGATAMPGGSLIYGGSDLEIFDSADGTIFVLLVGERVGRKFGTYCLRYFADGRSEWIELPSFTEGRAGVRERPSGLFVSWPTPNGKGWERHPVPGYVVPGWPTNGKTAPAPVAITTTPPVGSLTDTQARDDIKSLRKQVADLEKLVRQQAATIQQLVARPAGGLTASQVDDRIWSKLPDALYSVLAADNPGVVGQIRRVVDVR